MLVQDFKGNILQKIFAVNYAIVPDYSNEVLAPRNVDAYSFSLCQVVGRTRLILYITMILLIMY